MAIFIATFCFFYASSPASAGVVSFFSNLLGINSSAEEPETNNTQNMALLESTKVEDLEAASREVLDITIVNQNALLPAAGPVGTMADVDDWSPKKDQIAIYTVRKGDSIGDIAKMFEVSVNTILWANDLNKNDPIKEGQRLVILPVSGVQYTVKEKDTIKTIAKKFNGDIDEIIKFNDLPVDGKISVGQIILIPNGVDYIPETTTRTVVRVQTYSGPYYDGYYARPVEGGKRSQGIHGHNAIDIAASCGTPIFASASGEVILVKNGGWNAGLGTYAVISHPNGTQTLYAHLSESAVLPGWNVLKNQLIGYMGHTGYTIPDGPRGCHVHFEIRGAKNPF